MSAGMWVEMLWAYASVAWLLLLVVLLYLAGDIRRSLLGAVKALVALARRAES
jgi:hypothetical protein